MSDYIMGCRNGRDEYISELIRCQDCKYYCGNRTCGNTYAMVVPTEYDYCSKAERKNESNTHER